MKKIYTLLVLFFFCYTGSAQLTLTDPANKMAVGDVIVNAWYDSTSAIPKNTGAGQTWNFTSLTSASFTETTLHSPVSINTFSIANVGASGSPNITKYWNNQTLSLCYAGKADPTSTIVMVDYAVWLNWPTSFGNNFMDAFMGSESTPTYTDTWQGYIGHSAPGHGTVVLPNGNTHTNCLQVIRTITLEVSGTQPSTTTTRQYEYWSSLTKFPILTVEYSSKTSGAGTVKTAQIFANASGMSTGIPKVEAPAIETAIYPSPTDDVVRVSFSDGSLAEKIEIFDSSGKMVLSGTNVSSLNVAKLDNGVYLIKAKSGAQVLQRSFIKSN